MSESKKEVVRSILDLLPTVEEGISHTLSQLKELRYEEALRLYHDMFGAIISIEKALFSLDGFLEKWENRPSRIEMTETFKKVIEIYEKGNPSNLNADVAHDVLKYFKIWREELETDLHGYMSTLHH